MTDQVIVIGGGLAGSEAAWQLAERNFRVSLYEMRPRKTTGAHVSDRLSELGCSNSFGSKLPDRASGLLKTELGMLRSLLLSSAERSLPWWIGSAGAGLSLLLATAGQDFDDYRLWLEAPGVDCSRV